MNTHPDTLNGKTYAELAPLIPTITKIYPMNRLCGETAEKICDKLRLPDSYNDDTLRANLGKFYREVAATKLDKRHGIIHTHGGHPQKVWMFRFCDEHQSPHATEAEATQAAKFYEKRRQDKL